MATISILLPVYNSAEYLSRALDSLVGQTMEDLEILCVDDGSTDDSGKILDEYAAKDSRIRVFHQENAGPSFSRNLMLNNASGKYIMFCDSDDWYELNMCERMFQTIEEKKVDFVECNTNVSVLNIRERCTPCDESYLSLKAGLNQICEGMVKNRISVFLWNKIFKKEKIDQFGIAFPNVQRADDDLFVTCYCYVSETMWSLDEKLYHYVIRENSIMDDFARKKIFEHALNYLEITEGLYHFLEKHRLLDKYKNNLMDRAERYIHFAWPNVIKEKRKEYLDRAWALLKLTGYRPIRSRKYRLFNAIYRKQYRMATIQLEGIVPLFRIVPRYCRYIILSKICWGKVRRYYKLKLDTISWEWEKYSHWMRDNK